MCDGESHVDLTAEMIMNESRWICFFLYLTTLWSSVIARGIIRCDCTTQACVDAGKSMCVARESCYTELYQNVITRGCDPSGLACENRRPAGLNMEWPTLYCCRNKDLCNKHVIPAVASTPEPKLDKEQPQPDVAVVKDPQEKPHAPGSDRSDCTSTSSKSSAKSGPESQSRSKVINPIYIAVPVAGVCVLLALIIFAMYLLRRRTDYHHQHDGYHHHYHPEHLPALSQSHKQTVPHHCQCTCKKQTLPPCSKGNRCTESERSSSGSETKLFLQT